MPDYDVAIDLANTNTSYAQVVDLVGRAGSVLDVGCWKGDLGRVLKDGGARVSGIELDPDAAAVAAKVLDEVVVLDLDDSSPTEHFEAGSFEALVFADVLEHVKDPAAVLRASLDLLAPDGHVVISIPNVTHGSLRLAHLQGRWDLTETGLLDRTHIRFFNRDRLFDLLDEAGLVAVDLRGTTADPLRVEVEFDPDLPHDVVEFVRDQPDSFVYQFQVKARRRRGDEPVGRRIPLIEAVPSDAVRLRDEHAAAHEAEQRRRLQDRDYVVGILAASQTQRDTIERLRRRTKVLSERLAARNKQIEELQRHIDRTPSARLKRKARGAARRLRG